MDASTWISLGSAGIAAVSLGISGWAIVYARSSAKSNAVMAEANRDMAEETTALRVLAAGQRRDETEQVHRDLAPPPPPVFEARLFRGTPADSLVASVAVPRGYRIKAEAIRDDGSSAGAGLGSLLHPNQEEKFHFEQWPPGSTQPVTKFIRIRFWPPLPGDGVDVWDCPCGRPTGEALDGEGHWEWRVPVAYDSKRPRYRSFEY